MTYQNQGRRTVRIAYRDVERQPETYEVSFFTFEVGWLIIRDHDQADQGSVTAIPSDAIYSVTTQRSE
jgi:hypothetical protein